MPDFQPSQIHDLITHNAQHTPQAPALFYRDQTISYAQLHSELERVSSLLLQLGVQTGERIAVYLPKQPETVISLFAASMAGAVFVPINPVLKAEQVAHILINSGAAVLITSDTRMAQLGTVLDDCVTLKNLILVDEPKVQTALPVTLWQQEAVSSSPDKHTELAALLYTSGSTGLPKGVMLSHRNLILGAVSVAEYLHSCAEDRLLAVLPFSFDYGLSQLTIAFHKGSSVALMDYLLPKDVLKAVERYAITGLAAVPTLWNQLSRLDWPAPCAKSLRYITTSGGAMPVTTITALQKKLPDTEIYLMYGLTEAFRSTYLPPEQLKQHPESMGIAIPNAQLYILDVDNNPCPNNVPGQLVHAGELVTMGYWQDVEKTAHRFACLPDTQIPAVWSGDQVRQDEEGYYYFIGRMDEMIKTSGYRVSPAEVESVVQSILKNKHLAAVGVPHPDLGQAILLVVEDEHDADEIIKYCQKHLPPYMLPQAIVQTDTMPLNANHKIDRPLVANRYRDYFSQ